MLAALMLAVVLSLTWVARDAKMRKRNPAFVVILCFITWPLGFLFWRVVRPPPVL